MTFTIIDLEDQHLDRVVQIWDAGWREGHSEIVPPALTALRTRDDFRRRLIEIQSSTRVAVMDGRVVGFCIVKADEIYQLYVAPDGRGSGMAAGLIEDGKWRMRQQGYSRAWLDCAVGNHRAARFYEKSGWAKMGVEIADLETSEGMFPLEVWRFEIGLHII